MAKASGSKKQLSSVERDELLSVLEARFEKNKNRHKNVKWENVLKRLSVSPAKLWSLAQMESSGGEPDVVEVDKKSGECVFFDCSEESPKGRRSICYDHEALESRKENKPADSAIGMAEEMGIELLTEEQYRHLHTFGKFDLKTSSWIETPADIRKLKGAIFADYRYGKIFVYHNGAESYYAARGFRGLLVV